MSFVAPFPRHCILNLVVNSFLEQSPFSFFLKSTKDPLHFQCRFEPDIFSFDKVQEVARYVQFKTTQSIDYVPTLHRLNENGKNMESRNKIDEGQL